ncbi:MAG: LuxR family transcriptional regulator [Phenylobacterium sp.]|nr:MAG: LuxR family transcriptional regulator [Phenylobacterium sp.]
MTELAPEFQDRLAHLTPKERACLHLVARRLSSKEIAVELGIAKTSVDTYCNRARAKLGVMDRYEAARMLRAVQAPSSAPKAFVPPATPAVAPHPARRARLALAAAIGLVVVIAFGTLLSGLRALEVMKPVWLAKAEANTPADGSRRP